MKYKNPIIKYAYRIENKLDKDNYSVNHLNFNPSLVKSSNGYIWDIIKEYNSYSYERNDAFTYSANSNIYIGYSLFLNNRLNYYGRSYTTIQDALSSIGGTLNIIIAIMTLINNFSNSYIVLNDFKCLLNLFKISQEDIKKARAKNILTKKLKVVEVIKKNSRPLTGSSTTEAIQKIINEKSNNAEKETVSNESLNTEKSDNAELSKRRNKRNK